MFGKLHSTCRNWLQRKDDPRRIETAAHNTSNVMMLQLPDELLLMVEEYLSAHDRICWQQTCRRTYRMLTPTVVDVEAEAQLRRTLVRNDYLVAIRSLSEGSLLRRFGARLPCYACKRLHGYFSFSLAERSRPADQMRCRDSLRPLQVCKHRSICLADIVEVCDHMAATATEDKNKRGIAMFECSLPHGRQAKLAPEDRWGPSVTIRLPHDRTRPEVCFAKHELLDVSPAKDALPTWEEMVDRLGQRVLKGRPCCSCTVRPLGRDRWIDMSPVDYKRVRGDLYRGHPLCARTCMSQECSTANWYDRCLLHVQGPDRTAGLWLRSKTRMPLTIACDRSWMALYRHHRAISGSPQAVTIANFSYSQELRSETEPGNPYHSICDYPWFEECPYDKQYDDQDFFLPHYDFGKSRKLLDYWGAPAAPDREISHHERWRWRWTLASDTAPDGSPIKFRPTVSPWPGCYLDDEGRLDLSPASGLATSARAREVGTEAEIVLQESESHNFDWLRAPRRHSSDS